MFFQWTLPVLVVGIVVPLALTSAGLAFDNAGARGALSGGVLWLSGGNAIATSTCLFLAFRRDRIEAGISALGLAAFFYYCWGLAAVRVMEKRPVNHELANQGGWIALVVGIVLSLILTLLAWRVFRDGSQEAAR